MILKVSIKDIAEIDLDEVMEIEEVAYPNHHWSRVSFENEISNKLATYRCALTPKGDMAGFYGFWQILEEAHNVNPGIRYNSSLAEIEVITEKDIPLISKISIE